AARRIHPNDPQRIQRALEVYELSGSTATELYARPTAQSLPYKIVKLIVAPRDRILLRDRIAKRFQAMLREGLVAEVEVLRRRGDLDLEKPALRAVGYRQVWNYLEGKINCEEMGKSAIIATCQLAKRQFTWLRREPDALWLDSLSEDCFQTALDFFADALERPLEGM
ncbi:MAG TPA: tRNA dimethylallyltransferase, partial [Gammaproteobacteria bacterium]|nr:tRNA dimethylallyltransferase [Gammaproteobacteria bacterium]